MQPVVRCHTNHLAGDVQMKFLHSDLRFIDGRLVKSEPPKWFANAIADSDDWIASLSRAGATYTDEFESSGESLAVFEGPDADYAILYWDAAKCVAKIFIDN